MVFKRKPKKTPKQEIERAVQIKKDYYESKEKNLKSLGQFVDEKIGKRGTVNREEFDTEYDAFKLGVLIRQAREEKGLTRNNWLNWPEPINPKYQN
ncbi:hypothetical protein BH23BAC2_BH23BAC2_14760 [soil metagenome]